MYEKCLLHQESYIAGTSCRSCAREKRQAEAEKHQADLNRMEDVAILEAAIERGAGPQKGACHHCGSIFAEETRRRWAPGQTWSGDIRELEKKGVCPTCFKNARSQGSIADWDAEEWSRHFHSRLQKAEALREVADVLKEAQKHNQPLDDGAVQCALGPLIDKAVAAIDGAKRASQIETLLFLAPDHPAMEDLRAKWTAKKEALDRAEKAGQKEKSRAAQAEHEEKRAASEARQRRGKVRGLVAGLLLAVIPVVALVWFDLNKRDDGLRGMDAENWTCTAVMLFGLFFLGYWIFGPRSSR